MGYDALARPLVMFVLVDNDEVGVRLPLLDTSTGDDELNTVTVVPVAVVEDTKATEYMLGLMARLLLMEVEDISSEVDEVGMGAMLLSAGIGVDEVGITLIAVTVNVEA